MGWVGLHIFHVGMIGLGWFVKYRDQFKPIKNRSWVNVCLLNSYAQLKIGLKLVIRVGWVGFVLVWFCFSFGFWVRLEIQSEHFCSKYKVNISIVIQSEHFCRTMR